MEKLSADICGDVGSQESRTDEALVVIKRKSVRLSRSGFDLDDVASLGTIAPADIHLIREYPRVASLESFVFVRSKNYSGGWHKLL